MSDERPSYDELKQRLEQAEATLNALRRGEVDLVIGTGEPLVVRFKSLAEENERLAQQWQATFDATNDAIWVMDRDHRILQSNRTTEQLFGKPRQEVIGRRCWEIIHGTSGPIPECPILRAKQNLTRESIEHPMGGRWFQVTVDPIVDEESGYAGAVHIVSDITDRKRAEEKLKAEKEWSEKLANYAPNIVMALQKRSKIAFFNRFAEELTGYKAEEVIGKEWIKTFIPEEQRDVIYRVWDDIVDNRLLNHHFENEIITKSGERRLIEWRNTIITENGEFRMVLSHGVDITERKQAEAERERLTAAIEQAGENIIITDPEGTIRHVNPAFEKLTGYTRKEVIGKTPRILKSGKQDEA
ncbi:MAG: hypothetical protein DRH37_00140, partial [Deltaproteobacteria bacterium]